MSLVATNAVPYRPRYGPAPDQSRKIATHLAHLVNAVSQPAPQSGSADAGETIPTPHTHQPPALHFLPVPNPKGSRSERSEESEDPPQADRSSTRVRIA
jgi:hypothetical protein